MEEGTHRQNMGKQRENIPMKTTISPGRCISFLYRVLGIELI